MLCPVCHILCIHGRREGFKDITDSERDCNLFSRQLMHITVSRRERSTSGLAEEIRVSLSNR